MRQSLTCTPENSYLTIERKKPCFKTIFNKLFKNILPKVATLLVFLTSSVRVTASLLMRAT